jgi:predicted Zn-dependent protease
MIRCFALTALLFLLAACSVSEDQEIALGRQDADEINSQLPIVTDPAISGYIQAAVQVGGTALFARYSRLDELQADSEGLVNVTRAGYDRQRIPDLFQVLLREREHQPTKVEGWFASHPLEEARIQRAKALIAQLPLDRSQRVVVDTPEFQAFKTRVSKLPVPLPPRQLPRDQQQ